jgi:hypothetical protein
MKGVIFNIVEEVVAAAYGPDMWDHLLGKAGLDGIYTSVGSYPDAQLVALVEAASDETGLPPDALLRIIGRHAIPRLHARFPAFFDNAGEARTFILSLNGIIHPEVRKLYAGAGCPHFHFTHGEACITLGYNSPRRLCHLAEGFVTGLADHFGETIEVSQTACMHSGDPTCQIELAWA